MTSRSLDYENDHKSLHGDGLTCTWLPASHCFLIYARLIVTRVYSWATLAKTS